MTTTAVANDTARQAPAAAVEPTISDLLDRIERLEDDKVRIQDELDALHVTAGDNWLSEQRAGEIRLLVEDVLADADTRSSMLQDGSTAGWDGKFFLASPDGRFRLNFGGQLQVRWLWNYHDQDTDIPGFPAGDGGKYKYGFENTRTKLVFDGHMFTRDLTYKIQTDFGSSQEQRQGNSSVLQDAWIRYLLTNDWALRFGQFKLPYNREHLVDSMYQQVIERSLINESANIDRSQGVELMYAGRNDTVNVALSDGGQFNVTPATFSLPFPNPVANTPALSLDTEFAITARYQHKFAGSWDQFRQMTSPPGDGFALLWGIAAHYQQNDPGLASSGKPSTWFKATTDLSVNWGGANLFASFNWDYFDITGSNSNVFGAVVQGGMYFTEKFEGYARVEFGRFLLNGEPLTGADNLVVMTLGGNYYLDGQDVKFSADVGFGLNPVASVWASDIAGWRIDRFDVNTQIVVRTQFQLLF
jgi:hypothetical protein